MGSTFIRNSYLLPLTLSEKTSHSLLDEGIQKKVIIVEQVGDSSPQSAQQDAIQSVHSTPGRIRAGKTTAPNQGSFTEESVTGKIQEIGGKLIGSTVGRTIGFGMGSVVGGILLGSRGLISGAGAGSAAESSAVSSANKLEEGSGSRHWLRKRFLREEYR